MTDIENGYFLVKFQNKLDCERALSDGPWTIFGQYLIVQPWSMAFDPSQAYPIVLMAWVRFLGLLGYLYKHKILADIGETVGKVVKLDMNIVSRARGRFTRMAVYVNLEKPLVSKILINGRSQKVEYESLPTICFHCRRGHFDFSSPRYVRSQVQGPVVQQSFAVPGSSSQTPATTTMQNGSDVEMTLQIESGSSTCFSVLTSDEREREEVAVEVGILDSGKHSAVVFTENKNDNNKSIFPSSKNALTLNQGVVTGFGLLRTFFHLTERWYLFQIRSSLSK
ncbi:hypothetical protein PVK06_008687 [Gossypium arboreum]|uniref:DUF4283 domain-containing protein n=1 Tax=Gossypium arboreum TaxID=29729 RepID=A0ABR0QKL7_GOSAR|nr:hypothetical protein PVK06_008687 [Gossypium arboreum]